MSGWSRPWPRTAAWTLCSALLAWALAGCATAEVATDVPLPPAEQHALVVTSLTREGTRTFPLVLRFQGSDDGTAAFLEVGRVRTRLDWVAPGPLLRPVPPEQAEGRLVVFTVPPGRYVLQRWDGRAELEGRWGEGYHVHATDPGVRFEAAAGEITYIGNLHFRLPPRIGVASAYPYHLDVRDRSDRDLSLLRQRYADADARPIRRRLAEQADAGAARTAYANHFGEIPQLRALRP